MDRSIQRELGRQWLIRRIRAWIDDVFERDGFGRQARRGRSELQSTNGNHCETDRYLHRGNSGEAPRFFPSGRWPQFTWSLKVTGPIIIDFARVCSVHVKVGATETHVDERALVMTKSLYSLRFLVALWLISIAWHAGSRIGWAPRTQAAPAEWLDDLPWSSGTYTIVVDSQERTFELDVPARLKRGPTRAGVSRLHRRRKDDP